MSGHPSQQPFAWIAKYRDGSFVSQYNEQGKERSTDNIPARQTLESFSLIDVPNKKVIITIHFDDNQRLIYRRRTEMIQGYGSVVACHLVGWQQKINGSNIQSIAYVFEPDGRIELGGKFRDDHPWFYSPTIRGFEIGT